MIEVPWDEGELERRGLVALPRFDEFGAYYSSGVECLSEYRVPIFCQTAHRDETVWVQRAALSATLLWTWAPEVKNLRRRLGGGLSLEALWYLLLEGEGDLAGRIAVVEVTFLLGGLSALLDTLPPGGRGPGDGASRAAASIDPERGSG